MTLKNFVITYNLKIVYRTYKLLFKSKFFEGKKNTVTNQYNVKFTR